MKLFVAFLLLVSLVSCKHYHNLSAHYNGYFLGKQKLLAAEKKIFKDRKENYNRTLYVFPLLDTNQLKAMKKEFDDAIKSTAFALERHEKSNWTDDGYMVVGKARFYNREFPDAINTFKYVNGISTDKLMQQYALIELMRTYIEQGEYRDADAVKIFLRKMEVDKPNLELYYLTQAHLYRLRKDYDRTLKSLELALPEMKKGENKARMLYLQGQLYQKAGNDREAFKHYQQILSNRAGYEMELQSRLGMLLTGDSATVFSLRTERKLEKMLTDFKNKEYLDEIYYDLGQLELKRKNVSKSVTFFKKSTQAKGSGVQKTYSFLRLAEINFDKLRNYEEAKAYYDSTIVTLPKDEDNYAKIAKRQEVLSEFIRYLRVAQLEDSLQRMAKMSESDLNTYLNTRLAVQVKAEFDYKKAQEKAKKLAAQEKANVPKGTLQQEIDRQNSGGTWYFDNPLQVEEGKREFRKKWGNRPLADNWRNLSIISNELEQSIATEIVPKKDQASIEQDLVGKEVDGRKQGIMLQLPKTQEQRQKSLAAWESASLNLAKIYHFQLEELPDAKQVYIDILQRSESKKYEVEVYYLLYLLYNQQKNIAKIQEIRNLIMEKYAHTVYAKLIDNPNFLVENQAKDEASQKEYALIYTTFYEQKKFAETIVALEQLHLKYPENTILEKVQALRIYSLGRMQEIEKFEAEVEEYYKKYPNSKLSERLRELNNMVEEIKKTKELQNKPKMLPKKLPTTPSKKIKK